MLLKEIMTTDVEVIEPETSITNAAKKMRSLDVGALPVCDGRRLVGMVTDRDITIRATAEARNPDSTFVRDCMSPEIVYCFDDQDVEEAERVMQEVELRIYPMVLACVAMDRLELREGQVVMDGRRLEHPLQLENFPGAAPERMRSTQ